MRRCMWMLIAVGLGCGACKNRASKAPSEGHVAQAPVAAEQAVLTGRIRLADGFELPRYTDGDLQRKVLRAEVGAPPDICSPPKKVDRTPVLATEDRYLSGLMVAASGFTGVQPRKPKVHAVSIEDCRLTPRLVVAMAGDSLVLRNSIQYPFMPTFGPSARAEALLPGQEFKVELNRGGVESILCTVTASCGRTDVVTLQHPIYAVTDSMGRFELSNFPTGEEVTLNVWHPLFDEASVTVQLAVGERKNVDLVISPKPRFQTADGKIGAKSDLTGTSLSPADLPAVSGSKSDSAGPHPD